jgi:hypothetical protein
MRMPARFSALAATAALLGSGLIGLTATTAHATAQGPVDVTSVSGGTVGVAYSTNEVQLKLATTLASGVGDWFITSADVYRGSTKVGTVSYPAASGSESKTFEFSLKNSWGRGTFTIRNAAISAYTTSGSAYGAYTDTSIAGHFTVKSASDGNLSFGNAISVKASGHKKSFKVGLHYYSTSGWKPWKGHKVSIQEYTKKHWKTVKKLKLNSKGKGSWVRHTGTRYSYRLTAASSSTVLGGITKGTGKL